MAIGGPHLEVSIARAMHAHEQGVVRGGERESGHDLHVAAVETFGEAYERAENPDGLPAFTGQVGKPFMRFPRERLPVIARDEADDGDLFRFEAA